MEKCHVSSSVARNFAERFEKVLNLIKKYNVDYDEVGIFGSYARGDYKADSDIDFCIVTENRPNRRISGSMREDAELLGADILYTTRNYFDNDMTAFAQNLRRDYRRVL